MPYTYTNEELIKQKKFLISELQRFYDENGRVPKLRDMTNKNGYPSITSYRNHFGTWNNALEAAGLEINNTHKVRTGSETCYKCGEYLKENQQWLTKGLPKGEVMCNKCYKNSDYSNGKLNRESSTGKATISQRVVANVLNLEMKYDCNCSVGFKHPYDLYDKNRYNYINIKDSKLYDRIEHSPFWKFNLIQELTPDTYIMLGYDEERKNILRVWVTDGVDDLVYDEEKEELKKSLFIANIHESLEKAKPREVDAKPYNDMLHSMSKKRKETDGKNCFLSSSDLK